MKIGFDTDGVIIDTERFQFTYGIAYFKKKYIKNYQQKFGIKLKLSAVEDSSVLVDPNGYGIREVFGCSVEEERKFWTRYIFAYTFLTKPNKEIVEIIRQLHINGDQVFSLSSRAKTTEKSLQGAIMRALLNAYYRLWRIPFDKVIYFSVENSGYNKSAVCKEMAVDVMVEDKIDNIQAITQNSPAVVICKTTRNNADFNAAYRFNDDDIQALYRYIDQFKASSVPFKCLDRFERESLSREELNDYFWKMRQFYIATTFNRAEMEKKERNYRFVAGILKPFFDGKVKYDVIDQYKIPKEDGLILSFNHRDYIDTPLIMSIFKRPIHVLAKKELEKETAGKLLKLMGSVALDRKNPESRKFAAEAMIRLLLHGRNVLISPEGTRNKSDELLLPFDGHGAVSIAQKTGRPIVLFAISKYGMNSRRRLVRICGPLDVGISGNLEKSNDQMRELLMDGLLKNQQYLDDQRKAPETKQNVIIYDTQENKAENFQNKVIKIKESDTY